jgi:hypothetical protein
MKKNKNKNVNENEALISARVDSVDTIRAHLVSAGRAFIGGKYMAFNPHVGKSLPACWLVTEKGKDGVWRRLAVLTVVDDKGVRKEVMRDMLLTADAARTLVGV